MSKETFLATLRQRLAVPAPENLPHPLKRIEAIPSIDYARSLDDPVGAFAEAAQQVGARVHRIERTEDLFHLIYMVVSEHQVRTAVLTRDPEVHGIGPLLENAGATILAFDSFQSSARADLGVSGARWAIAATGTLVLDAGRAAGRSATLLPTVHLSLVRADRILRDSGQLLRRLDERIPEGLPSQIILSTGPSRSADIELELTIGVHAPGHVWVGILQGLPAEQGERDLGEID